MGIIFGSAGASWKVVVEMEYWVRFKVLVIPVYVTGKEDSPPVLYYPWWNKLYHAVVNLKNMAIYFKAVRLVLVAIFWLPSHPKRCWR